DRGWAGRVGVRPDGIGFADRWPVNKPPALPAVGRNEPVGGAVDVDHRCRVRRGAGVELGGRVRTDGSEDAAVAGQRVAHDAAVADPGGINPRLVDWQRGADLADHRGDKADVVDVLTGGPATAAVPIPG